MRRAALLMLSVCLASSALAAPSADHYSAGDFTTVRKFDSHVHDNVGGQTFLNIARKDGFELLSINVDYPDFPPLAMQAGVVHKLHAQDPARLHFATAFSMKGFGTPGWTERTNAWLDQEVKNGAIAVKVWKNIGMVAVDEKGKRVFLDDPRFDGVMRHIEELKIPLIAHQGEPKNCWLPLCRRSRNGGSPSSASRCRSWGAQTACSRSCRSIGTTGRASTRCSTRSAIASARRRSPGPRS